MKATARFFLSLFFILAFCAPALSERLPEPLVEYSADTVVTTGGRVTLGKVYHAPYMERQEERTGGRTQVVITRMDLKLVWILMPSERSYVELPVSEAMGRSKSPVDLDYKYTTVGPDFVNGTLTTKSSMQATAPDGTAYEGYIWVTREGILVKMTSRVRGMPGTEYSMELKRLRTGAQPRSLFNVPKGYRKLAPGR
ncbi:MAG TPA: hypothetical protein VNK06_02670 [Thermodesulfobacteriota bacterium]|nr:hypothetical protein [Thermodesulfobacteriota bacterium]